MYVANAREILVQPATYKTDPKIAQLYQLRTLNEAGNTHFFLTSWKYVL